jgi:hypothetical protein
MTSTHLPVDGSAPALRAHSKPGRQVNGCSGLPHRLRELAEAILPTCRFRGFSSLFEIGVRR